MDKNEYKNEYKKIFDACVFKKNLKQALKMNNMQQKDLAEFVGVSPSMFSTYFNGKYVPKYETVQKMAKILGVPTAELYDKNYNGELRQAEIKEQETKLKKEYELHKPIIEYLKSIGYVVEADFDNAVYAAYSPKDQGMVYPCWIDEYLEEKIELTIKSLVFDWAHGF